MNKKIIVPALLLSIFIASLGMIDSPVSGEQSLAPALDWRQAFKPRYASWITQTIDGSYAFFIPGTVSIGYSYYSPATLTKIASNGDVLWVNNFSQPFPLNFIYTSDAGFVCITLDEHNVLTLCKLDSRGNSQWNKTIGGSFSGSTLLVQTNDNGYAVAIQNFTGYLNNARIESLNLLKTDSQGIIQWTKTYQSLNSNYTFRSLIQTDDDGFALTGSFKGSSNGTDFCLVKIASDSNLQWSKRYGGIKDDDATSLLQTSNGDYALIGDTLSFGAGESDALFVLTNPSGNLLWAQTYGGFGSANTTYYSILHGITSYLVNSIGELNDHADYLIQTSDEGFAFAGSSQYSDGYSLVWLVKTDANGVQEWNQTYPPNASFGIYYGVNMVIQSSDSSFVMAGYSEGTNWNWFENQVALIIKTDSTQPLPSPQPSVTYSIPSGFYSETLFPESFSMSNLFASVIVVAASLILLSIVAWFILGIKRRKNG